MANALVRTSANEYTRVPELHPGCLLATVPKLAIHGVNR